MQPALRVRVWRLGALVLIAGLVCAAADPTVYLTKTGKKYHRDGCQYLSKSRIEKSLGDAVAAGYTACKRCRPPQAAGKRSEDRGTKDNTKRRVSSRCTATTKKGTRCKRKASAGSSYCWQHQR